MAAKRSKRRLLREKFRKRSSSWFRKGDELAHMTGAEVYVLIRWDNQYFTYKSIERPGWPPSEQDVNNQVPAPFRRYPKDFESPGKSAPDPADSEANIVEKESPASRDGTDIHDDAQTGFGLKEETGPSNAPSQPHNGEFVRENSNLEWRSSQPTQKTLSPQPDQDRATELEVNDRKAQLNPQLRDGPPAFTLIGADVAEKATRLLEITSSPHLELSIPAFHPNGIGGTETDARIWETTQSSGQKNYGPINAHNPSDCAPTVNQCPQVFAVPEPPILRRSPMKRASCTRQAGPLDQSG